MKAFSKKRNRKLGGKGIWKMAEIVLCALAAVLLILFIVLWAWSPGKAQPFRDEDGNILAGSISEIVRMDIGGTEQGMIIRGGKCGQPCAAVPPRWPRQP